VCVWSHLSQTLGVCLVKSQAGQVGQGGLVQPLMPPLLLILLFLLQPPQDPLQSELPHLILRCLKEALKELALRLRAPPQLRDLHAGTEGHLSQAEQALGAAGPQGWGGGGEV